jgi:hypothetical protein
MRMRRMASAAAPPHFSRSKDNPFRILKTLDGHLGHPVRMVLHGRAGPPTPVYQSAFFETDSDRARRVDCQLTRPASVPSSDVAKKEGIAPVEVLDRVTMQFLVRGYCTMIAAPTTDHNPPPKKQPLLPRRPQIPAESLQMADER